MQSHPMWVCGLKRLSPNEPICGVKVTPYVGVWIETECYRPASCRRHESHPMWVCGLKH